MNKSDLYLLLLHKAGAETSPISQFQKAAFLTMQAELVKATWRLPVAGCICP
jgi:hypothetical protein